MELIAKSNPKLSILEHSTDVNIVSEYLLKSTIKENLDAYNEYKEIVKLVSLFHDIGKSTEEFQNKILKNDENDKNKFRHNEIGWAFLCYTNIPPNIKDYVLDSVYWHHGISNKLAENYSNEILDSISEKSLLNMINEFNLICNKFNLDYIFDINYKESINIKSPTYYSCGNNINDSKKFLFRGIIIGADHIASEIEKINNDFSEKNIEKYIKTTKILNFQIDEFPFKENTKNNLERFELQKLIATLSQTHNTLLPNAPAGFGKTLLGILFHTYNKNKTAWVCPRNDISKGVYNSIINLFRELNIKCNVCLYLSGEIKEKYISDSNNINNYDIVITNIDNFINFSADNSKLEKLYLFNNYNVIIDELQEFSQETPLYAAFITIMRTRHKYTNSKSLLLTATASLIYKDIEANNKIYIHPNNIQHINAVHDKKYKLNFIRNNTKEINYNNFNTYNSLTVFNKIENAQEYHKFTNTENILLHSNFLNSDKQEIIMKIYDLYDKKSNRNIKKSNVISTNILSASHDLSFNNINMSLHSPEYTIQLIGRNNRWGDINESCNINIINNLLTSEKDVVNAQYNLKLADLWFEYFKNESLKYNNELTLNEIYEIYNNFNIKYEKEISEYLESKFENSYKKLERIYPFYKINKNKSDIKTANGNKYRSNGNEIYFICKKHENDDEFIEEGLTINIEDYSTISKKFKEEEYKISETKLNKHIKKLANINFLGFKDLLENTRNNYVLKNNIDKSAIYSHTPYLRFDVVYHKQYGVIDKTILQR